MSAQITCPKCGLPMNHQADKLREPTSREEAEKSTLGGVVLAVFACPNCGWIEARRGEAD